MKQRRPSLGKKVKKKKLSEKGESSSCLTEYNTTKQNKNPLNLSVPHMTCV